MAVVSKKDKLLEEAQKLALRGQFDKAAKTYEQILALEPSAVNLRQKLAELLIKCGRSDDARKEFETIGKYFAKNGFYLKAIAVYKQLQKLFPTDISLSLTLAELNEKHGLVANALTEYKLVYEYYEKVGNIPESLSILDKMQTVDPQNVPIKIKLAEAYHQNGKKNEAYSLFTKISSLLLERGDNTTLAKICGRVKQLFPDKSGLMLEILTELIAQGNASAAIDGIQNLLRANPNNKQAWDLVVQAYRLLEQPQRMKLAYQHYLKFFPAEPDAMSGLIESATAERDIISALDLLDKYEEILLSAGYISQLEQVYKALDKLDPINIRVTEGLIKVASAAGDESAVLSHSSKLQSLRSVSGAVSNIKAESESLPSFLDEQTFAGNSAPSLFGDTSRDLTGIELSEITEPVVFAGNVDELELLNDEVLEQLDEEIEIEIDLDSPFADHDSSEYEMPSDSSSWLDSVGELFDAISTAPRGVKFSADMDSADAQSHFDLGQAFKEMGLFDEAINEFRQASQDSTRRIECLIMQCVCLRERGEVDKAITILQALLNPGLSAEECCAVKYELATGYETVGKLEEASMLLNEINAINPGFRDISSRINAANLSESLDFSDEDLDGFGMK